MEWLSYDIRKINRLGTFPFQVKMLYFSHNHTVDVKYGTTPDDMLEFSIRLEPRDSVCSDVINSHPIRESFPNLVWKKPGGEHRFHIDRPRDAISFGYPAERIEDFRKLGLYPDRDSMSFSLTPEIEHLANEYRKLCLQLYTPGVADQIAQSSPLKQLVLQLLPLPLVERPVEMNLISVVVSAGVKV